MRRLAATLPALLALLIPAAATAAEQLSIATTGDPEFPERSYVLQTEPPAAIDAADLEVRENGAPVRGLEVSSASGSAAGEFASVLAVDASLSVRGGSIEAAMRAARAFAAERAPAQGLGVVAFNGSHEVLLPLTDDAAAIGEALAGPPQLGPGTHLHDAVAAAIAMLERDGAEAGSVVLLSDGADTGSEASEEAVVRRAAEVGVRIFVVGIESDHFDPATLTGLASDADYTAATDPAQLEAIFASFGVQRAAEHLISYRSAAAPGDEVTVEVRVDGLPGAARAGYRAPREEAAGEPGASGEHSSGFWSSAATAFAAGLLIALLFGLAVFAAIGPRRESVIERLRRFGVIGGEPSPEQTVAERRQAGAAGPLAGFDRRLAGGDRWRRFQEGLEVAKIDTPAIEILVATGAATLLAILLILALLPFPVLALLALLIPFAVRAGIERRLRAVRTRFAEDLADNLQVVASALRAGHSLVGALAVLVDESSGPAREEFQRIVAAERVGVPLEETIREVARRMDSRDLEQLALVAIIQRESGGNTAEIIDRAVATIRERAELRRMMASLTAQGRLTRGIVTALPVVLLIAISLLNPEYVAPLFETAGGQILLAIAAGMIMLGSLAIKRIVEVRV